MMDTSGNGIPVENKLAVAPVGGSGPQVVQNADILVKQTTSSSSREQSDDDDMEGEAETTGNANPVQQRLQRRFFFLLDLKCICIISLLYGIH